MKICISSLFLALFSLASFAQDSFVFKEKGYFGIQKGSKVIVLPEYKDLTNFQAGFALAQLKNGSWTYLDKTGKRITKKFYDKIGFFEEGIALVQKNGLFGIVDTTGQEIVNCSLTDLTKTYNGFKIARGDKRGRIQEGKVIPPIYDTIYYWSGFINCVKDKKIDLYLEGKLCYENLDRSPQNVSRQRGYSVGNKGARGFVGLSNEKIIDFKYDVIENVKLGSYYDPEAYSTKDLNFVAGTKNGVTTLFTNKGKPIADNLSITKDRYSNPYLKKEGAVGFVDENNSFQWLSGDSVLQFPNLKVVFDSEEGNCIYEFNKSNFQKILEFDKLDSIFEYFSEDWYGFYGDAPRYLRLLKSGKNAIFDIEHKRLITAYEKQEILPWTEGEDSPYFYLLNTNVSGKLRGPASLIEFNDKNRLDYEGEFDIVLNKKKFQVYHNVSGRLGEIELNEGPIKTLESTLGKVLLYKKSKTGKFGILSEFKVNSGCVYDSVQVLRTRYNDLKMLVGFQGEEIFFINSRTGSKTKVICDPNKSLEYARLPSVNYLKGDGFYLSEFGYKFYALKDELSFSKNAAGRYELITQNDFTNKAQRFIDADFDTIIRVEEDGFYILKQGDRCKIINDQYVVSDWFASNEEQPFFANNMHVFVFENNGKTGFLSQDLAFILPASFDHFSRNKLGLILVSKGKKTYVYDEFLRELITINDLCFNVSIRHNNLIYESKKQVHFIDSDILKKQKSFVEDHHSYDYVFGDRAFRIEGDWVLEYDPFYNRFISKKKDLFKCKLMNYEEVIHLTSEGFALYSESGELIKKLDNLTLDEYPEFLIDYLTPRDDYDDEYYDEY